MLSTLLKPKKTKDDSFSNLETRWRNCLRNSDEFCKESSQLQQLREVIKEKTVELTTGSFKENQNKIDIDDDTFHRIITGEAGLVTKSAPKTYFDVEQEIIQLKKFERQKEQKIEKLKIKLFFQAIAEHDDKFREAYAELVMALDNARQALQLILKMDYKIRFECGVENYAIPCRWQPGIYIAEKLGVNQNGTGFLQVEIERIKNNLREWPKKRKPE